LPAPTRERTGAARQFVLLYPQQGEKGPHREAYVLSKLLTRLDLAIAKAQTEGIFTDEINASSNKLETPITYFGLWSRSVSSLLSLRFVQRASG
jgi:hypothetical protein